MKRKLIFRATGGRAQRKQQRLMKFDLVIRGVRIEPGKPRHCGSKCRTYETAVPMTAIEFFDLVDDAIAKSVKGGV